MLEIPSIHTSVAPADARPGWVTGVLGKYMIFHRPTIVLHRGSLGSFSVGCVSMSNLTAGRPLCVPSRSTCSGSCLSTRSSSWCLVSTCRHGSIPQTFAIQAPLVDCIYYLYLRKKSFLSLFIQHSVPTTLDTSLSWVLALRNM